MMKETNMESDPRFLDQIIVLLLQLGTIVPLKNDLIILKLLYL